MPHCVVQGAAAKHAPTRQRGMTRARATAKQQAAARLPTEAELLWAVESLHRDQLRPCSRILRLRLAEQPEPRGSELRSCDANRLRSLCAASPSLCMQTCDAGEWYVTVPGRVLDFVDVYSEEDVYSESLWRASDAYFKSIDDVKEHMLPRGRYASARALMARRLPFLQGLSLGQVCHFVQIAISKRKILGYVDGGIVPYAWSVSMVKSRCAEQRCPLPVPALVSIPAKSERSVADWPLVRLKLREILKTKADQGQDQVQLSNVKRLFRSLYGIELSETALGHTTLTGLLSDQRLHDVCSVQVHGRGHVVVPAPPCKSPMTPPPRASQDVNSPLMMIHSAPPVERTFIHFGPQFPDDNGCPVPSAMRRWHSLPAFLGSSITHLAEEQRCMMSNVGEQDADSSPDACNVRLPPVPPLPCLSQEKASVMSTNSGGERSTTDSDTEWSPALCPDEPLDLEDAGFMMPPSSLPLATPSPQSQYFFETARVSNEASEREAWEATCIALGIKPIVHDYASFHAGAGAGLVDKSGETPRMEPPQFCADEVPLVLEEEEGDNVEMGDLDEKSICALRTPSPLYSSTTVFPWMKHQDHEENNRNRYASRDKLSYDEVNTGHSCSTVGGLPLCTERFPEPPRIVPFIQQQDTIVLRLAGMI